MIQRAGIMRLTFVGAEHLTRNGPHLIVANHDIASFDFSTVAPALRHHPDLGF